MLRKASLRCILRMRGEAAAMQSVGREFATGAGMPEFTSKRYKVERGLYATLTDRNVEFFQGLLGTNGVITDPDECEAYNVDWLKTVRGNSRLVLKPSSTEQVSAILRYCHDNKLAVCPQSGNTGLVGGSVPVFDEVVLSMKHMNRVIEIDELSGTLVCQAGCILENLERELNERGLMMPLDLGAKGSCLIGGCVSTNAGGLRLLRYGNLHGTVLGLEAVKADGQVIDSLTTLKKNNTGYHLKHLFIGSEGTLGVVTKVSIQCPPLPKAINLAFLGTGSFEKVLETYRLAKRELAEILSSCELIDRPSMELAVKNLGLRSPLAGDHEFYVLIESSGSHAAHDEEKLSQFVEKALSQNIVADGTLASEPAKIKNIWEIRERLAEALLREGYLYKYDVSLPLTRFYNAVPALRKHLRHPDVSAVTGFGHLGDGNLHLQVSTVRYNEEVTSQIQPFIFQFVSDLKGSVSAEHGIGFMKTKYLHYSKTPSEIELMRELKKCMDPRGILNPYKVLYPA